MLRMALLVRLATYVNPSTYSSQTHIGALSSPSIWSVLSICQIILSTHKYCVDYEKLRVIRAVRCY